MYTTGGVPHRLHQGSRWRTHRRRPLNDAPRRRHGQTDGGKQLGYQQQILCRRYNHDHDNDNKGCLVENSNSSTGDDSHSARHQRRRQNGLSCHSFNCRCGSVAKHAIEACCYDKSGGNLSRSVSSCMNSPMGAGTSRSLLFGATLFVLPDALFYLIIIFQLA